jgi:3-hydroxyacyl-[acyl-carrier-protein] dehydratase
MATDTPPHNPNKIVPKCPMGIQEIQQCIPHRYPFLLIDRVLEAVAHERIVAIKNVSFSDPVLQGHFPGNPVFPGVMIVEAIAQAAAVLGHLSYEAGLTACLLTEVSSARFRRQVVPGDVLTFDVRVARRRAPFFWFDTTASVAGELAAEVKLSAFIK